MIDEFSEAMGSPDRTIAEFADAVRTFPIRAEHLVADLALIGFANDVLSHARAAVALVRTADPRSSLSPARAAKEAADEMVLLGTSSTYDQEGARYYVLATHEAVELRRRLDAVDRLRGQTPDPIDGDPVAEHINEMAAAWDSLANDKGDLLRAALAGLPARRYAGFSRWNHINVPDELATRFELLERMAGTGADLRGIADLNRHLYSAMCMHAHPRPRVNPQKIWQEADGTVRYEEFPNPWSDLEGAPEAMLMAAIAMGRTALGYVYRYQV